MLPPPAGSLLYFDDLGLLFIYLNPLTDNTDLEFHNRCLKVNNSFRKKSRKRRLSSKVRITVWVPQPMVFQPTVSSHLPPFAPPPFSDAGGQAAVSSRLWTRL